MKVGLFGVFCLSQTLDVSALDYDLEASCAYLIEASRGAQPAAGGGSDAQPERTGPLRDWSQRVGVGAECRQRGYHGFYPRGSGEVLDTASAEAIPAAKAHAGVSGELQVLLPIDGLVNLDVLRGRLE